jgi:AhpD family alkylhydroperoxidase
MQNALDAEAKDELYGRSNLKKIGHFKKWAREGFNAYANFSAAAVKPGTLSEKFKEIIAVAVAHSTQCPYCIDVHTRNAEKAGATKEELSEAILIASALLAGGAMPIWRI